MKRGPAFYREVTRLAVPILLQNLCTTLLGLVDTFMVGRLGEVPLAAVLVANTPVFSEYVVLGGPPNRPANKVASPSPKRVR